jgi:transposase
MTIETRVTTGPPAHPSEWPKNSRGKVTVLPLSACRDKGTGTDPLITKLLTLRDHGGPVPALPSWLTDPLWDQFAALLPRRETYDPTHPLGCHRRRISDRIVFDKLLQVLRFGCSYQGIADTTCSATTIRDRRDEWIKAGLFAQLKRIALEAYDRIVGLVLEDIAVDGCITKAPDERAHQRGDQQGEVVGPVGGAAPGEVAQEPVQQVLIRGGSPTFT